MAFAAAWLGRRGRPADTIMRAACPNQLNPQALLESILAANLHGEGIDWVFEMFSDIEGIVKLSLIHLVTGPLAEPMIGSVCAEMLKVMYYTTFLKYHYSRCFT